MKFTTLIPAIAVAASVLSSSASAAPPQYTLCSSTNSSLNITEVTYEPDSPVPGEEFCATVKGNLTRPINNGSTLLVNGTFLGIEFSNANSPMDLCQGLSYFNITCPVPAQEFSTEECKDIPSDWRPSNITLGTIKMHAKNADGTDIICIEAPIQHPGHMDDSMKNAQLNLNSLRFLF
ncbi:hypothetical protein BX616_009527 [Lobosporangium transversale]|uniref:Phosphatidylglycerol/phosphatidylinositol transfer protein n=1 Tax=Lobosporangium transversale TaxID=64571 RepID=A0A1Y2GQK5_9FUNG|nr:hypothetical protein BCR41DRAFT_351660 [Lobosporangium transversale]KAF9913819.1 hypothetical protein BX616_009527 [Lobosporangium transversale]ORZ19169.1 hypothetical protein BCR41DRAFT_351660 [Lobosporangium transversale]|eukprot:XP_021882337.1 hypothetical protein BCR41DRAFT_351660 [Lobosporangium transversale]